LGLGSDHNVIAFWDMAYIESIQPIHRTVQSDVAVGSMDDFLRSVPWFHPGEDRERFGANDLARGDQFLMYYA
jgi:hypothetical protein